MWMMPLYLHVNQKSDYDEWVITFLLHLSVWENPSEYKGLKLIKRLTKTTKVN